MTLLKEPCIRMALVRCHKRVAPYSRIMVKQTAATNPSVIAAAAPAAGLASDGVRLPADRLLGDTLLLLICP